MTRRGALLGLALLVAGCNNGTASLPPCNAMLFLFGTMDVTLDCPAKTSIPLLSRSAPPG